MKRVIDVSVAVIGLIGLGPLMASIGLVVLLCMGRPMLFRQVRPGRHAQPFQLLKFRTMRNVINCTNPESDNARVTRLGNWLRRTSLDELPELWNVLVGDMSLVGPRPLLMDYIPLYTAEQARRHEARPGITGWAQINGRNTLSWEQRLALDVWYVDHATVLLDLKILAMTIPKVLRGEGITNPGTGAVSKFTGTGTG